jgi:hypothetical protein
MTTWSTVPTVSNTFSDFNDTGGYVEAGYVLVDYVTGNIWTAVAAPSTTWVPT